MAKREAAGGAGPLVDAPRVGVVPDVAPAVLFAGAAAAGVGRDKDGAEDVG